MSELSKLQELVYEYYSQHPRASRIECCKEVYGKCDVFFLQNLSSIEAALRRKGFLFYTVNGLVINMEDEDIPLSDKLKVQKKMGNTMLGFIKSNVRIIGSFTNPALLEASRETVKVANALLLEARNNFYGNPKHKRLPIKARPQTASKV